MRRVIAAVLFIAILLPGQALAFAKAAPICSDPQIIKDLTADLNTSINEMDKATAAMKAASGTTDDINAALAQEIGYFINMRRKYEDYKTTSDCEFLRLQAIEYAASVEDASFYTLTTFIFPSDAEYSKLMSDAWDHAKEINNEVGTKPTTQQSSTDSQPTQASTSTLKFSGTGNKVLDSFTLPKGIYKISVTTKEAFALYIQSLDESACQSSPAIMNEINTDGDLLISAEVIYTVNSDCKVILSTQNSRNQWTLTITPAQ